MIQTTTLAVAGMTWGTCERHVMRALEGMTGVMDVRVDLNARQVTIIDRRLRLLPEKGGRLLESSTVPPRDGDILETASEGGLN